MLVLPKALPVINILTDAGIKHKITHKSQHPLPEELACHERLPGFPAIPHFLHQPSSLSNLFTSEICLVVK